MKLPQISIVIPSYNKADYLKETLDSIFSQDYPNLEVIIQDGGSTDGTLNIIKHFSKKYPKTLKWSSQKDNGQVDAINTGLKKARGQIISFINCDDIYEKKAFFKVAEAYLENKESLWFAGEGEMIDEKGENVSQFIVEYKNYLLHLNKFALLLIVNYLFQPSVFITREAYDKFGPFPGIGRIVIEYGMWLKLAKQSMPTIINHKLSKFRITYGGLSLNFYKNILKSDYEHAQKYTTNPIILFLHSLHNWGRNVIARNSKLQTK